MSEFRFQPHESLDEGVRRIALAQAECVRSAVAQGFGAPDHAQLAHSAVSHLLGVLSLVRGAIDEDEFEQLVAALRPAADLIHAAHDASAVQSVLGRIGADRNGTTAPEPSPETDTHQNEDASADRSEVDRSLELLLEQLAALELHRTGFDAIEPGLERTLTVGRERFFTTRDNASTEAVRMWLGSTHSMAAHARLLHDLRRPALGKRIRRLDALTTMLEQHLDLGLARESIVAEGTHADDERVAMIDGERSGLEAEMLDLGTRLFQAPPRKLLRRWRRWWEAWAEPVTPVAAPGSN